MGVCPCRENLVHKASLARVGRNFVQRIPDAINQSEESTSLFCSFFERAFVDVVIEFGLLSRAIAIGRRGTFQL